MKVVHRDVENQLQRYRFQLNSITVLYVTLISDSVDCYLNHYFKSKHTFPILNFKVLKFVEISTYLKVSSKSQSS